MGACRSILVDEHRVPVSDLKLRVHIAKREVGVVLADDGGDVLFLINLDLP
jgi:hypothetical protein